MGNIAVQKILSIILILLLIIAAYFVSVKILIILLPFILGYLLAKLFKPVIKKLNIKNKIIRGFIIFFLILFFIFLVSIFIYILSRQLADFLITFINRNPQIRDTAINTLQELSVIFGNIFADLDFQQIITNIVNQLSDLLLNVSRNILNTLINFFTFLPQILIFIIITFISSFFFTKDYEFISNFFDKKISPIVTTINENEYFKLFREDVLIVIVGYLKAQLILMSITFTISSIGLFIIGIENFLPKALIISIVDALPIFGTAIFYFPWSISKFIVGNFAVGVYLLILYGIITITRQVLEPKIFGVQIGLYPLVTLLSIYAGLKLIGVLGIFLGPIFVIATKTFVEFQREKTNVNKEK